MAVAFAVRDELWEVIEPLLPAVDAAGWAVPAMQPLGRKIPLGAWNRLPTAPRLGPTVVTGVEIPPKLRSILVEDPDVAGPTLAFTAQTSKLLSDNSTPFFPGYTDHGPQHVAAVLRDVERLVPDGVWEADHWTPLDSAVSVVACFLHDLAMHLQDASVCSLIAGKWARVPVDWFDRDHETRPADYDWKTTWMDFQREVRKWPPPRLLDLLGPNHRGTPGIAYAPVPDPAAWTIFDRLVAGEFIRRHHARIAHEIALHGFPGLDDAHLALPQYLADIGGVVARSHGEPLRLMHDYVRYRYSTNLKPGGALLVFLMGLVRVADYLQLDANRAPAILLQLKAPLSRRSVDEWMNHSAVSNISWYDADPRAVRVELGTNHSLRSHLNVERLLRGVQSEMDTTSGVLSEVYGGTPLREIRLAKQRVVSNVHSPSLRATLPYEPVDGRLRASEELFQYLIGPLYGEERAIAGRELVQNAVDAVRLRWAIAGDDQQSTARARRDADVVVALDRTATGYQLRVTDRGIGMTSQIIVTHFLTAGRSYGPAEALAEGRPPKNLDNVPKAGHFGIGLFAAFLFGRTIRVTTRHLDDREGFTFAAEIDGGLIELRRTSCPVGTTITVDLEGDGEQDTFDPDRFIREVEAYYCLRDPRVVFLHEGTEVRGYGSWSVPPDDEVAVYRWRDIPNTVAGRVQWGYVSDFPGWVAHNGIAVRRPLHTGRRIGPAWQWRNEVAKEFLLQPTLAFSDPHHSMRLALDRYSFLDNELPVESDLLLAIGRDVVACGLTTSEFRQLDATTEMARPPMLMPIASDAGWFPLMPGLLQGMSCDEFVVVRPRQRSKVHDASDASTRGCFEFEWIGQAYADAVGGPQAGQRPAYDPIAHLTGLQPLAMYMTSNYPARGPYEPTRDNPDLVHIAGRRRLVSTWTSSAVGAAVGDRLERAAVRWLETDPDNDVTLIAYGGSGGAGGVHTDHPLTTPWLDIIGGPMPWSEERRSTIRAKHGGDDPCLMSSLRVWDWRHGKAG